MNDYKEIKVADIVPPDGDIRLEISDEEIFELSESMKEVGLIHAILVTERGGKYEVVAGHRRLLAAERLKWKSISCEVRELDKTQIALIRATENLQRKELSEIEEGAIYADLFDNHGLTMKEIGDKVGKSAMAVKRRMGLLQMDGVLQKAVHTGKMKMSVAEVLCKIEDKKELYRYAAMAIENGVTSTVAKLWTEEYRKGLQYLHSGGEDSRPVVEIEREEPYYTACSLCQGPMEYKDMRTLKVCVRCYDLIVEVVKQGHFKREGGV